RRAACCTGAFASRAGCEPAQHGSTPWPRGRGAWRVRRYAWAMSTAKFYWCVVAALAVLATALVWDFFTGHVPWTRAMLYGFGAGLLVVCFGIVFDDLA